MCYVKKSMCYVKSQLCTHSATGWRRLIGSSKLQIIFHKRAIRYRSLLRKMIYKDKGSYESSPPCLSLCCVNVLNVLCSKINVLRHTSALYSMCYVNVLCQCAMSMCYAVATVSRINTIIGLFCRISSVLEVSFAKETYSFIDPTNQSHLIRHTSAVYSMCYGNVLCQCATSHVSSPLYAPCQNINVPCQKSAHYPMRHVNVLHVRCQQLALCSMCYADGLLRISTHACHRG